MARPTLRQHRKFRALSRALGSPALAWGSLELLWHTGYDQCDALIGTAQDVEEAICWRGKAGRGVAALVAAGFMEATADGYVIHDLWDHCPDYVQKRRRREDARKERPRPDDRHVPGGCLSGQSADTQPPEPGTNGSTPTRSDVTPAPAPTPTPTPAPTPRAPDTAPRVTSGAHKTHALCGQVCLPSFLWEELVRLRGGDETEARGYVEDWWLAVDAELARGHPPIGDALVYLRQRWAADHPTPKPGGARNRAPTSGPRRWCDHEPPCRHQQEHNARLVADRVATAEVPA
jgi:hypothetical protein